MVRVDETSRSGSRESSVEPVRLVANREKENENERKRKTDARYDVLMMVEGESRKAQTDEGTARSRESKRDKQRKKTAWNRVPIAGAAPPFHRTIKRELLRFFHPVIREPEWRLRIT